MPALDIPAFAGLLPKADPHKLPSQNAVAAHNSRVRNGNLEAWSDTVPVDPAPVLDAGVIDAVFLYERSHWFSWANPVNAILSPIAQDDYARVYYTGDGKPKVTSNLIATGSNPKPAAAYDLGVPAPTQAITASVDNSADPDTDDYSDDETRYYFYTYVTEYGEEGPQGPASAAVEVAYPGAPVSLTVPIPATNTSNITHKRIYRSTSTGGGTDALLVATITLATTAYTDTKVSAELGLPLETASFDPPPEDMAGLVLGANGIAAAFAGNQALFCEPYLPYAWPLEYRQSTDHNIVAIAPTTSGFVFATEGYPWFFSGVSPDAITSRKIELAQACVSARSMVDMGAFVLYASPDGLVLISESDARVVTEELFTKREWQDFQPETIHAYLYEGQYVAFYGDTGGTGNGAGGFIYDPRTQVFTTIDTYATAGYVDLATDALYLVVDDALVQWDAASARKRYRWRSKVFRTPPVNFGFYRVFTEDPTRVGLRLFCDGRKVWEQPSLENLIGRLPGGKLCERWQVELFGTAPVERFMLGTDVEELG